MVDPYGVTDEQRYNFFHRCTPFGTVLTGVGTVISGTSGKVIKLHQYTMSMEGTLAYNFCVAKPGGGTINHGAFLADNIATSANLTTPFVPYPNYICATTAAGSALCLGTWGTTAMAGTVRIQGLYSATDSS
jgi:hypothetical protein